MDVLVAGDKKKTEWAYREMSIGIDDITWAFVADSLRSVHIL